MQRKLLIGLFVLIQCVMLAITVHASLVRNVFDNAPLTGDVWFQATLLDAYCAFLTFYVWVAYRETRFTARVAWFVLIMSLGSIAISAYMLIQLWNRSPDALLDDRQPQIP